MLNSRRITVFLFSLFLWLPACGSSSSSSSSPSVTGDSVVAGSLQNSISWSGVTGAVSYNIHWATASGVTTATGTKITSATSPYTHSSLINGTKYYYIVTAVNSGGESLASNEGIGHLYDVRSAPDTGQTTSYTSTFGEDSDYSLNSHSYTDNGNSTVTDNVTGGL